MSNRILKVLPYILLLIISILSIFLSYYFQDLLIKSFFINLASSAIFVLIAYFTYEKIKSFIQQQEIKYIDSYIKRQVSSDVFVVLYTLKKYIHGYNLDSNTIQNIFEINNYDKKLIYSSIIHQKYLGFQIFKEMEDVKDLFNSVLDNNFIIKYSPKEYVINFLKIIDKLISIEHIFRNEENYIKNAEKAIDFKYIDGKSLNPNNEESRFILLKKTQIEDRFVVYDSGKFDQSKEDKLLNFYSMKKEMVKQLSDKLYDLNKLMQFWLPEKYYLSKYQKSYRIIQDFFSQFTKTLTQKRRIFVGDIVETKNK